jgi:hypothetical protein
MLTLALLLAWASDTVRIRPLQPSPPLETRGDSAAWGPPSIRLPGGGLIWLTRDSTAVCLTAWLPDSSPSWNDRLVLSLDTSGDRARTPQHDDFEWEFHRVLDSSIVYRGRQGRWQPPRDDPDWRLGPEREGGGWTVREVDEGGGWSLMVRFDPEFFTQGGSVPPGLFVAAYDEGSRRWTAWPAAQPGRQPAALVDQPVRWGVVQP